MASFGQMQSHSGFGLVSPLLLSGQILARFHEELAIFTESVFFRYRTYAAPLAVLHSPVFSVVGTQAMANS